MHSTTKTPQKFSPLASLAPTTAGDCYSSFVGQSRADKSPCNNLARLNQAASLRGQGLRPRHPHHGDCIPIGFPALPTTQTALHPDNKAPRGNRGRTDERSVLVNTGVSFC